MVMNIVLIEIALMAIIEMKTFGSIIHNPSQNDTEWMIENCNEEMFDCENITRCMNLDEQEQIEAHCGKTYPLPNLAN